MKFRTLAIGAGAALTLNGCPQRVALRLAPGSTASTLSFVIGSNRPKAVDVLQVTTCERVDSRLRESPGVAVWRIEGWELPAAKRKQGTVHYGVVPEGFTEAVPAGSLGAGCYNASVMAEGLGSVRFWIDTTGSIRSWTNRESDSAYARYARHAGASHALADSAIIQCKGRYRTSSSARDSTEVDHWIPVADLLSSLTPTCRDYRRLYWSRFQSRPWSQDSTGSSSVSPS